MTTMGSIIGDRIVCNLLNLFKSRLEADTPLFILLTTACLQMIMFWLILNHAFNLEVKFDFTEQYQKLKYF